MSNVNEEPDVYSPNYTPDPVAQKAAREAVAATDHEPRHPWISRILVTLGVIVVILGTIGLVLGALNAVNISHQNDELGRQNAELKREQKCISQLLINFEVEQNARGQIAADDRKAVDDVIRRVSQAKSPADVKRAFAQYRAERRENDKRRVNYPLPADPGNCLSPEDRAALEQKIPGSTVSPQPSAPPTKKKAKPNKHKASNKPTSHGLAQPYPTPSSVVVRPGSKTQRSGSGSGSGRTTPVVPPRPSPKPSVHTPTLPNPVPNPLPGILQPITRPVCHLLPIPLKPVCT